MGKLTHTQLIILSAASARDDGIAVVPAKMNKPAASKVGASLVARKLMREARSKPGMLVWREDKDGRPISLIITRAGRDAIGVEEDTTRQAATIEKRSQDRFIANESIDKGAPRAGTKQALVIAMLCAKEGATLDALIGATGWLPHTTRAALTGFANGAFRLTGPARRDRFRSTGLSPRLPPRPPDCGS